MWRGWKIYCGNFSIFGRQVASCAVNCQVPNLYMCNEVKGDLVLSVHDTSLVNMFVCFFVI